MSSQSTVEPTRDDGPSEQQRKSWLVVVRSADAASRGVRRELDPDGVLPIGRDVADPGLQVEDRALSRLHARITWDGRYRTHRIGDAKSANGCVVNGRRVSAAVLAPGDLIRLGDTLFVYGRGAGMDDLHARADAIATSDLNVLLVGPTGSGKEVLARRIHRVSGRKAELVAVNCAAIAPELVASELFGHTRGAFSGAGGERQGLFVAAGKGTVLLDEIGELKPDLQAVLLRVLQERTVRPVGSDREISFEGRVIAATNADLKAATSEGWFRADLYARLSEATLSLPSLAERREDVLGLFAGFLSENGSRLTLSVDAAEALVLYDWPMNVRELESVARQAAARSDVEQLNLVGLSELKGEAVAGFEEARRKDDGSKGPVSLEPEVDRSELRQALADHGGNVAAASRALGKPRSYVYRWMKAFGVSPQDFRR